MYYTPVPYRYEPPQENHPRPSRFPIQSQIIVLRFIGFALLAGTIASPFAMVYRETRLGKVFYLYETDLGLVFLFSGLLAAVFSFFGCPRLTLAATTLAVAAAVFLGFSYTKYVPLTELVPYEFETKTFQNQRPGPVYLDYYGHFRFGTPKYESTTVTQVKTVPVSITLSLVWMVALAICHVAFVSSAFLKRRQDRESPT